MCPDPGDNRGAAAPRPPQKGVLALSVLTDPSTYPISAAAARQLDRALLGHVIDGEVVPSLDRGTMPVVVGRCHCELRREPGGWRISRLVLEVLWAEDKTDPTGYLALIGGRGPQG